MMMTVEFQSRNKSIILLSNNCLCLHDFAWHRPWQARAGHEPTTKIKASAPSLNPETSEKLLPAAWCLSSDKPVACLLLLKVSVTIIEGCCYNISWAPKSSSRSCLVRHVQEQSRRAIDEQQKSNFKLISWARKKSSFSNLLWKLQVSTPARVLLSFIEIQLNFSSAPQWNYSHSTRFSSSKVCCLFLRSFTAFLRSRHVFFMELWLVACLYQFFVFVVQQRDREEKNV